MTQTATLAPQPSMNFSDALELGIQRSQSRDDHKKVLRTTARLAVEYFTKRTGIRKFGQIEEKHIADYIEDLQKRGLKPSSQRHYIVPIRLAYNALRLHTKQRLDFKAIQLPKRTYEAANFVPADDMFRILDCMRAFERHRSFACVAAGFMAGLRISEFNRLTPDKLRGDELEISGITKNNPSRRVIPIPETLVIILEDWFALEEQPLSCVRNLGQQIRNSLDMAYESLCLEGSVEPREAGRKSWMQWASSLEVPSGAARAYAGHVQRQRGPQGDFSDDILHTSYQFNAPPRPEQSQKLREPAMRRLRELVLAPIDNAIKASRFRV